MDVFIESNFLLELAFRQADYIFCERIWRNAQPSTYSLHLPQYALGEVFQMLRPLRNKREEYLQYVLQEITQHRREDSSDAGAMDSLTQQLTTLLAERTQVQTQRLYAIASEFASKADGHVLTSSVIEEAQALALRHGLSPQDALVYASVLTGLRGLPPQSSKLFISRNKADFGKAEIIAELQTLNCEYLASFRAAAGRLGYSVR
jgi:predicted nucleic acid-binding protein